MDAIRVTPRKARKSHFCNACLWLESSGYRSLGATFSEYRLILEARSKNWKILPGEVYDEVALTDWGRIETIRQKPEIHEICIKYGLYDV